MPNRWKQPSSSCEGTLICVFSCQGQEASGTSRATVPKRHEVQRQMEEKLPNGLRDLEVLRGEAF